MRWASASSDLGCAPSPSLKLSTNTALWQRQEDDIDINCGEIVDGSASIDEMGERIFRSRLRTVAIAEALDQYRTVAAPGRRHRHQLRRDRRRQREHR